MFGKWSVCGVLSLGKCKFYVTVCLLNILLKLQLFVTILSKNHNHCVQLQTHLDSKDVLYNRLAPVIVQRSGLD